MTSTLRTKGLIVVVHAVVVGAHAGVIAALLKWAVVIAMRKKRLCCQLLQAFDCAFVTIHAFWAIAATAVIAATATVATAAVAIIAIDFVKGPYNANVNAIGLDSFIVNHAGVFLRVFIHSNGDASLMRVNSLHVTIRLRSSNRRVAT